MTTKKRSLDASRKKHKSLNPKYNAKTRWDLLDADYLDKLNDEELEFYAKFMAEYVSGGFDTKDIKNNIHELDKVIGINSKGKPITYKKDCYDRNNHRNSDLYSVKKATGYLGHMDEVALDEWREAKMGYAEVNNFEEAFAEYYDEKNSTSKEKKD